MRILITAGPTFEPIDPIRYIGNRSTGRQGAALANVFAEHGDQVTLVNGPRARQVHGAVRLVLVETASQMALACEDSLPVDVAICTAAVSDYYVVNTHEHKWRKVEGLPPPLQLAENPDILRNLSTNARHRPRLVIGFAGEMENIVERALDKLKRKGCDWIFANDISPGTGAMGGGNENTVVMLTSGGTIEPWPRMTKEEVAKAILERVVTYFHSDSLRAAEPL
jgi:phosphopantothenoylcysteine decarboxylase/phosphopantothenate--cysteine ligase